MAMGRGEMLKQINVDDKEDFTPEQIQKFKDDGEFYRNFVRSIENATGANFAMVSQASCFSVQTSAGSGC